ncbi:MAG: hypothetical protein AB7O24_16420 [Kofleriaceae bacterium]
MGNQLKQLSICPVLVLGLTSLQLACGDDPSDYNPPPPGVDAPPMADGGVPIDSNLVISDATDAALPIDAPGNGAAPVITLIAPDPALLIAGVMRLEVEATDDDGIAGLSATISSYTITMDLQPGTNRWVGLFDTKDLAGMVVPTVIVRAIDNVGDDTQLGFQVTLDNEPPLSALDPANVRMVGLDAGDQVCSAAFDPLGGDAPNDGEVVAQLFELRARVTDLSNSGTMTTTVFIPYAGVQSVELYVFDDSSVPLVVDSDADGICDDINPNIVPAIIPMTSNEAAVVTLNGIVPSGTAYFGNNFSFGGENAFACGYGTDTEFPASLCFAELDATIAISTPFGDAPQVFGIPPVATGNCMGYAFDARANNIDDGWACVATLTYDKMNNRSVSAPLRICIDADDDGAECPEDWGQIADPGERPNCTGTVTAGVVNATACTPREYFRSSVANEFELVFP